MSERWEEPVRTEQDARLEEEERGDLYTYIPVQDDWLDYEESNVKQHEITEQSRVGRRGENIDEVQEPFRQATLDEFSRSHGKVSPTKY